LPKFVHEEQLRGGGMSKARMSGLEDHFQEITFQKLYQLIQDREDFTEEQLFFLYRLVTRKLYDFKPPFYFTDAFSQ